ncbi:MAG: hypothetical protein AAB316_05105 [Bacteroidota bacterium]
MIVVKTVPPRHRIDDLLASLHQLKDNWDEDGALAPAKEAIEAAADLVARLQKSRQPVYHLCPGPLGEVMVDVRIAGRSVEFLFYPQKKWKFVKFYQGKAEEGKFSFEALPHLLNWLHEKNEHITARATG